MSRLEWDGDRLFDSGLDRGVLYLDGLGVAWNGLVGFDEQETDTIDVDHYFDGNRLLVTQQVGEFAASISAYTYPDAFAEYNGYSEQNQYRRFGFSYRTQYGSGYKLHIVYSVLVNDGSRSWKSVSSQTDPSLFTWDISAAAVPIPGAMPAAHLCMEVGANSSVLSSIEDILYGTETTDPRLPSPQEMYTLYENATLLRIVYNGDGTYTASGPDEMVRDNGDGTFTLNAPSIFLKNNDVFTASSY